MSLSAQPKLESGRVYRTQEFRRWTANPARLAKRLVRDGKLRQAAHGLFYAPIESRFGQAPPDETEILLDQLAPPMSPFVRLEVGRARVLPHVQKTFSSFVHEHLGNRGMLDDYADNRPAAVRCVHPLVTLLGTCQHL